MLTFPRLALIFTIGLAAMGTYVLSAGAQETGPEIVAVDADTDGNSPNALGETDACSELAVGEERDIDIVARGIPKVVDGLGGMDGFEFDFSYDEQYLIVTAFDIEDQLIGQHENSTVLDAFTDDVPSESGEMKIAALDFATDAAESGDGVLARLTVRGVGAGTSDLRLTGVLMADTSNVQYTIEAVQNALLAVGVKCAEGATPPPPPATAQPSPAPGGDETPPAPGDTDAPETGDGGTADGSPPTSNGGTTGGNGDGDDGNGWVVPVVIAVAIAVVAAAGGVYALRRRGSTS